MAAPQELRYPPRANGGDDLLPAPMDHRRRRGLPQQLLDSGALVLLTWHQQLHRRNAEHVLAAFLLWLLGVGLASLSLVAGQFPRLAAAGAALAGALRNYLLGGL